jgi:signal transduction histidine kinase
VISLRTWGRIVAWCASGSFLAAFAFGGAALRTSWRLLAVQTAVGFVVSTACVALCTVTIPRVAPIARGRFRYPLNWGVVTLVLVGNAMAGTAIAVVVLTAVGYVSAAQMWQTWLAWVKGAAYFTLLFGIMGAIVGELQWQLDRATLVIRTKERDEAEARRVAAEAQLASLESRVNPHFLFNTLNSIAALTHSNPAAAERMTNQLAALMRSSLDAATAPLVSLEEEVKLVRDYLEIERVRFDRRLNFTIDVSSAASDTRVPRLALQTVVENSIKYAVSPRRDGGHVDIRAVTTDGMTRIQVEDDGPGFDGRMPEGHGLSLVKARLTMTFGEQATLAVDSSPDGTSVTLTVPRPA